MQKDVTYGNQKNKDVVANKSAQAKNAGSTFVPLHRTMIPIKPFAYSKFDLQNHSVYGGKRGKI